MCAWVFSTLVLCLSTLPSMLSYDDAKNYCRRPIAVMFVALATATAWMYDEHAQEPSWIARFMYTGAIGIDILWIAHDASPCG